MQNAGPAAFCPLKKYAQRQVFVQIGIKNENGRKKPPLI